eukprot:gb/GECH01001160.1/.p1 GENE.gb/GECH01001160.1/~~gb/GECH01001160.1/.p1  ORF type:complete len:227 (+),score=48.34 gb/GECH01001160.1/:1-681(+)
MRPPRPYSGRWILETILNKHKRLPQWKLLDLAQEYYDGSFGNLRKLVWGYPKQCWKKNKSQCNYTFRGDEVMLKSKTKSEKTQKSRKPARASSTKSNDPYVINQWEETSDSDNPSNIQDEDDNSSVNSVYSDSSDSEDIYNSFGRTSKKDPFTWRPAQVREFLEEKVPSCSEEVLDAFVLESINGSNLLELDSVSILQRVFHVNQNTANDIVIAIKNLRKTSKIDS